MPGPLTSGDAGPVLRAIAAADAHLPGIRCLRLLEVEPSEFAELREEVLRLCATERPSSVTRPGHVTNWTGPYGDVLQYSLLSRSSRYDDYSGDHDLSCFGKRFRDERSYPRLGELIRLFPHAVNFRVNVLGPGAGLSAHEEHALFRAEDGGVGIRARLHLPVETNPAAELALDGEVHALAPGSVYYVNHGCVHSAGNGGDVPRVHLVWDVLLTREAYALLFGTGATGTPLLTRVRAPARESVPRRTAPVEGVRRLAPLVPPGERGAPTLCEPQ